MARRGILAPSGPRKHPGSTQFHCALIVDDADSCYDALLCLHVSRLRVSAHRQQRPQYGHIICRLAAPRCSWAPRAVAVGNWHVTKSRSRSTHSRTDSGS